MGLNPIEEGRYDFGVELSAGATADFGNCVIETATEGYPVGLVRDHNVEGVSNRDDACS